MKIPENAYVKYLIVTNCMIPYAKNQIIKYIDEENKWKKLLDNLKNNKKYLDKPENL